uniref:CUB domain-containing protein n=1 Tax=Steinernema glaseri TaxID=37863 RepID=A0A1I8A8G6_9BILA
MCNPQLAVLYDGPVASNGTKVIATLTYSSTAEEINKIYRSSGNAMTVHYDFSADQCDNAGRGFVFRFETEKESTV